MSRGETSKEIYKDISNRIELIYNGNSVSKVKVNGNIIEDDEKLKEENWEQYAYRLRKEKLSFILKRQYENIVVLTGAGSSYGFGNAQRKGKLMGGLWLAVLEEINYAEMVEICKKIEFDDLKPEDETTNLESLLTHAQLYNLIHKDNNVETKINEIKRIIKENCTLELPLHSPHKLFLKKLTTIKKKYARAKIFTLNYDTLFEQAAEQNGIMIIDGFSFTFPRKFKGTNFDLDVINRTSHQNVIDDNYISKVIHIYKPHGSINWKKDKDSSEVIQENNVENPLMVYPSTNKYESSYQQPFFEMMTRFQQETRAKNSLLIIIGYSFSDSHINAMIYEALSINPSLSVVFVSPNACRQDSYKELHEFISGGNISLTSQTFEDFVKDYPESKVYSYEYEEKL
ncbi:SIR2 family protein [Macrococcus bovicus]|uniref:SIR2 family protein n=1 Tax=Macrococcus bovicus TaxID=69968 RepID=UPI0025A4D17A|nr:SIR2 family protein [Macrococcus bovicus]WJP97392.1 SIR2 family protein [Macrococcus bovicus]